jgi:hypothetical protein
VDIIHLIYPYNASQPDLNLKKPSYIRIPTTATKKRGKGSKSCQRQIAMQSENPPPSLGTLPDAIL